MTRWVSGRWQTLRWRVAARVGRALLGGRVAAIEARLRTVGEDRDRADRAIQAQLAELARAVRETAAALPRLEHAVTELHDQLGPLHHADRNARQHLETLDASVGEIRDTLASLRVDSTAHSQSIAWFAERHARPLPQAVASTDPISVIMPAWNAADRIAAAIESVRQQTDGRWELLVVDDGSTDATQAIVGRYTSDSRVRLLAQPHRGVGAARNLALTAATGSSIAYLDTDNTWFPDYLATVRATFDTQPGTDTLYLGQLVDHVSRQSLFVRALPFDRQRLRAGNFIDLNVFAHRRTCFERWGGFDETLTRLGDWDLILRYTAERPAEAVAVVGGRYRNGGADRISSREPYGYNFDKVQRKLTTPLPRPCRVLYALDHYPHLPDSHIRTEITELARCGAAIVVCAQGAGAASPSAVPITYAPLAEAIAQFQPHVVHVHGLSLAARALAVVASSPTPLTVCEQAHDFDPAVARALAADPFVRAVFLLPHHADRLRGTDKVRVLPPAFDPALFPPALHKDHRLVVQAATGRSTHGFEIFLQTAARCPTHRFVLMLARRADGSTALIDQVQARNDALGHPAEIQVNLSPFEVAERIAHAGVYLHTNDDPATTATPSTIVEAMATGALVLAPRTAEFAEYVGQAGDSYDATDDLVGLLHTMSGWDDTRWAGVRQRSEERAYLHYSSRIALQPLRDVWEAIARDPSSTANRLDASDEAPRAPAAATGR